MRFVVAALLVSSVGCRVQSTDDHATATLAENARIVLEKHCGRCHIGTYETALPRALAVFDLANEDWSAHLSEAQLRSAKGRIDAPEDLEGNPSAVTPEDRAVIAVFVAQKLGELANARPTP